MNVHTIGVMMNGVTGRMGTNQHLVRSILAIREQGGVKVGDNEIIMPEPLLVGRNENKLKRLSDEHGGLPFTADVPGALQDNTWPLYFDAQTTVRRYESVKAAIAAGKHIYCEKPIAMTSAQGLGLHSLAERAGVKHGVVQDKLWLPGLRKLKHLIDSDFFGRILSVRVDFGYWVFTGEHEPSQRPSWNSKRAEGGGVFLDMLCHWRYVIDNLFGYIKSFTCLGAVHVTERWDEQGRRYDSDADDAIYATFITDRDIICHLSSSWCTRVRRDDLLMMQVDGMKGSAVAGLRECWIQPDSMTPKPVWNPDIPSPIDYRAGWALMPTNQEYDNAFKAQWELFLRHVVLDEPFPWNLKEGAKGVQLAELAYESWEKRRWMDVPEL